MAKTGETGVIDIVAKMGGAHNGKKGETGVIDIVAKMDGAHNVKMGETHCGKNG